MVLARDDGEDARYFANATAAAFMTQWYDMPWDGREHDKQEDRVTLEVGLNLPVDGSTDPGSESPAFVTPPLNGEGERVSQVLVSWLTHISPVHRTSDTSHQFSELVFVYAE